MAEVVAFNSAALAVASGSSYTYLTFDSEDRDTGGMHSVSSNTGRLVAPSNGVYVAQFKGIIEANSSSYRELVMRKNGTTIVAGRTSAPRTATDDWPQTLSAPLFLSANDYLEVGVRQESGVSLDIQAITDQTPYFNMAKIAASDYAFVHRSTAFTVASGGTWKGIPMDTDDEDPSDMHDPSADPTRVWSRKDGWYLIHGQIAWAANTTDWRGMNIKVNGYDNPPAHGTDFHAGGNTEGPNTSIPWMMQVQSTLFLYNGEYVELAVRQTSGGDLDVEATSGLSAYLSAVRLPQN